MNRVIIKEKEHYPNKAILVDVLKGLKKLPTASADIIIADPPYNIGKDFGECKDSMELSKYIKWCKKWISESMRVLKPNGTFYIYGFSEILAHIYCAANADYKRWLIWHYTNKNSAHLGFWQRSHESIVLLGHNKPQFNEDDIREPYTDIFLNNSAGKVRKGTISRFCKNGTETVYNAHANGALPRDVLKQPALAGGAWLNERAYYCKTCELILIGGKEKKSHANHEIVVHPTQKPLALTSRLIKAAKNPKDQNSVVVLFAGTGAECVSAIKEGCKVVSFDINSDYIAMSNLWIAKALGDTE